jgi:hypothetical protein
MGRTNARRGVAVVVLGALAAIVACSGKAATPNPTSTPLPCRVDAVLEQSCRSCHTNPPKFGAPMPLLTFEDLHAAAPSDPNKRVYELVGQRIHDDAKPMPQAPNPRLSALATTTLDDWIAQGAPARADGESCTPTTGDGGTDSGDPNACTPDTSLKPTTAWTMPQNATDEYVCYGFDYTPAMKRQVIRMTPRVQNDKIVHHMLLFQSDSATSFDGTPKPCSAFGQLTWKLMYGWAPGGGALTLPPEAGFPAEGTTHYVVQVHYNNVQKLTGETDTSGFDLCTTDKLRPNDADVFAFGSFGFSIPVNATKTLTCNHTVTSLLDGAHVIAALPHMHKIGKNISTTIPASQTDLGTVKNFSFDAQAWVPVDHVLKAGEVVETKCTWVNDTGAPVKFGENTADEMCFSFTMYYPKKKLVSWAQPATASSCN